ncbi:MAG: hypothetical protein HY527_09070 [Betaproteobacteria bacterium]|nr:hypothetical protein [Betaproteobacteria bacterium]
MTSLVNKFLLLFALLVIPLQGVAAAVSALQCQAKSGERTAHVVQAQEIHAASVQDDGHPVDDTGTNTHTGHFCCHQVSVLPLVMPSGALPDFPVWAPSPTLLYDPFFPEQPKRPPLA